MSITRPLLEILSQARVNKFLGPGSLDVHVTNAAGFVDALRGLNEPAAEHARLVDLGSGGGVPALVIAQLLPTTSLRLVERGANRALFLEDAVAHLGLHDRVEVVVANAEDAARQPDLEGWADVVTARGFAQPSTTAECACRFLRPGGVLIVSEPPAERDAERRWPSLPLGPTGLVPTKRVRHQTSSFQILTRTGDIEDRLPRRPAVTRRRPLY